LASTVLPRLAGITKVGKIGIDRPLQRAVALADGRLHPPIAPVGPQAVELVVGVEHHRRPVKAAGLPGGARMQSDDEERMPAQAQAEAGVIRVTADLARPTG